MTNQEILDFLNKEQANINPTSCSSWTRDEYVTLSFGIVMMKNYIKGKSAYFPAKSVNIALTMLQNKLNDCQDPIKKIDLESRLANWQYIQSLAPKAIGEGVSNDR